MKIKMLRKVRLIEMMSGENDATDSLIFYDYKIILLNCSDASPKFNKRPILHFDIAR